MKKSKLSGIVFTFLITVFSIFPNYSYGSEVEEIKNDSVSSPSSINWLDSTMSIIYNHDYTRIEGIKFNRVNRPHERNFELVINGISKGVKEIALTEDGYYYLKILDFQEETAKSTDGIDIFQTRPGSVSKSPVYQKPTTAAGEVMVTTSALGGWTFPSNRLFAELFVTYNLNTKRYKVNAPVLEQTPGTFSYSCSVVDEISNTPVSISHSASASILNIDFSGTGESSYLVNATFTDHFYGTTVGGKARIYNISENRISLSSPRNLTATKIHSTGLRLNWQGATGENSVSEYRIYRSDLATNVPGALSSEFRLIETLDGSNLTYFDGSVSRDNRYRYKIQAIDSIGTISEYSKVATLDMGSSPNTKPDPWDGKYN